MVKLLSILFISSITSAAATFQVAFPTGAPVGVVEVSGGYVVASSQDGVCTLRKLDLSGSTLWTSTLAFTGGDAEDMALLSDGGFLLAGYSVPSMVRAGRVVRTDSQGQQVWASTISFPDSAHALGCAQSSTGMIAVCGTAYSSAIPDGEGFLSTFTSGGTPAGTSVWNPDTGHSALVSVAAQPDGGYSLCGISHGDIFSWAMRTASDRSVLWTRSWMEGFTYSQPARCIAGDSYGMVMCGTASIDNWYTGGYADLLGAGGDTDWHVLYMPTTDMALHAYSIDDIDTGGFCVTGSTMGRPILIRTDASGNQVWRVEMQAGYAGREISYCSDGGFIIAARTYDSDSTWVFKTDGNGFIDLTGIEGDECAADFSQLSITAFPNPCSGPFSALLSGARSDATLEILDLAGRTILRQELDGIVDGSRIVQLDLSGDAPGIYFMRVSSGEASSTGRLVLVAPGR